jgi:hypothetical protein
MAASAARWHASQRGDVTRSRGKNRFTDDGPEDGSPSPSIALGLE